MGNQRRLVSGSRGESESESEERDLEGGALHVDAVIDHGLEEVRLDLHIYVCFYHLHTHTHTHTHTQTHAKTGTMSSTLTLMAVSRFRA